MADDPSPQDKLAQEILSGGPIVGEATQALGKLFQSTFAALTQDIETRIQSNETQDQLSAAVNHLTRDMIQLLRKRVEAALAPVKPSDPPPESES